MSGQKLQSRQPVKRRNRMTIVCTNCKRRKSKCDRKQPCSNCTRLGDQDSCSYIQLYARDTVDGETFKNKATKVNNGKKNVTIHEHAVQEYETISDGIGLVTSEPINMIPSGFLVSVKRSAATEYSLFTDVAIEHRDPYLQCLITFRSIAIGMTMKNLKTDSKNLKFNPSLPQSFTPLSIFDADGDPLSSESAFKQLQLIHKSLFDKFGSYRKYDALRYADDDCFIAENLPPKILFLEEIIPYFETHILKLIPIFDMSFLRHELTALYDAWAQNGRLNYKKFDHVVYSLILLITKICQLSMNLSKLTSKIQFPLRDLNTNKYISIVNHFLFKMKSLRKCTLLQLQCLLLLRFYYWCGPEDGDGAELQHSRILSGTIISSCKEMGINWNALLCSDNYHFQINSHSRTGSSVMVAADYKRAYRMIWCYVLFWDRKLCLINGQECLIDKSFQYDCTNSDASWHERITALDWRLNNLNKLLNDFPTKVDVASLHEELAKARDGFSKIENEQDSILNFDYGLLLSVFELCLVHAEMVHYEYNNDAIRFAATLQKLWAHIVQLSHISISYFNDEGQQFDSFTRFYSNKTMVVAANKICVLIPAMILRVHRFSSLGFPEKDILVKFLFGFSSLYFTEFGFDYYCSFKKMFTAKISYKILNRPAGKDPWNMILEFLLTDSKRNLNEGYCGGVCGKSIALIVKLREALSLTPKEDRDILKTWSEKILPICKHTEIQGFELYVDQLRPFLVDLFSSSFNLFASFYDNASSKLVDGAEKTKSDDTGRVFVSGPKSTAEDLDFLSNSEISTVSSTADPELANLELIQDLFEPFDFVSFF